jgi:hypothetical protein
MFYLLKSTNDREETGDIILDLSRIEAFSMAKVVKEKNTYFQLRVFMISEDFWMANFETEDEMKQEMLKLGVPESIISDMLISERNEKKDKEEKLKELIEKIMK